MIAAILGATIAGRSLGGWLKLIGAVLLAAIPVIAYFAGRSAGGTAERARQQRATLDALRRIQDADASGPRTADDAARRMRDGSF